jgi:hypothetical protein
MFGCTLLEGTRSGQIFSLAGGERRVFWSSSFVAIPIGGNRHVILSFRETKGPDFIKKIIHWIRSDQSFLLLTNLLYETPEVF